MKRSFYIIFGFVMGFVLAELLRRPQMNRLAKLEVRRAAEKEQFAEYDRQWQEDLKNMPFEERMEYELWEAGMRLNNWMPPEDSADWEDDDDEET